MSTTDEFLTDSLLFRPLLITLPDQQQSIMTPTIWPPSLQPPPSPASPRRSGTTITAPPCWPKKKPKTIFSHTTREKLSLLFSQNPRPRAEEKEQMADDFGLTYSQVDMFFMNSRKRLHQRRRPRARRENFPSEVIAILREWYFAKRIMYPTVAEKEQIIKDVNTHTNFNLKWRQLLSWYTNVRSRYRCSPRC